MEYIIIDNITYDLQNDKILINKIELIEYL